jgi:broad specificity phosphatase PhoE
MTTIHLVRHGEVHNPEGIIYGRLPGYGLSDRGRDEVRATAQRLGDRGPIHALICSPLQRARESAEILSQELGLSPTQDERLAESEISGYQGRSFDELPRPYITEEGVAGIESAASMRQRMCDWAATVSGTVVAVSHRDPIGLLLLHWLGGCLDDLPGMNLPTGSLHSVQLHATGVRVEGPAVAG